MSTLDSQNFIKPGWEKKGRPQIAICHQKTTATSATPPRESNISQPTGESQSGKTHTVWGLREWPKSLIGEILSPNSRLFSLASKATKALIVVPVPCWSCASLAGHSLWVNWKTYLEPIKGLWKIINLVGYVCIDTNSCISIQFERLIRRLLMIQWFMVYIILIYHLSWT